MVCTARFTISILFIPFINVCLPGHGSNELLKRNGKKGHGKKPEPQPNDKYNSGPTNEPRTTCGDSRDRSEAKKADDHDDGYEHIARKDFALGPAYIVVAVMKVRNGVLGKKEGYRKEHET
jgi:hypothetical protein